MRSQAATLSAVLLTSLTGCEQEPTFDERYDAAAEQIRDTASEIDEDLKQATPGATGTSDEDKSTNGSQSE